MSIPLSQRTIQSLCGRLSYQRGEAYYRAGKVQVTKYDPEAPALEAAVQGNVSYEVTVELDPAGNVDAACTCPSLHSYDNYCSHIAAVLLHIQALQRDGHFSRRSASTHLQEREPVPVDDKLGDSGLVREMLGLFTHKPRRSLSSASPMIDTREPLEVEFICKPYSLGHRRFMFGIELKVGPKRLYIAQNIGQFLDIIDRRASFEFSKSFSYDPELHSFSPSHDAIIRKLVSIYRDERLYQDNASVGAFAGSRNGNERMLLIPPASWDALCSLLAAAPSVKLEHSGTLFEGLLVADEPIPIRFEFGQGDGEIYQLNVHGMDKMVIMEAYGVVLHEGKLIKLQGDHGRRLSELKIMLDTHRKRQISIPPEHIEDFMDKAVPGLMKLGAVHISQAISDRMLQQPLKAKLYLDRVKDRLLAGLEFHYGDIAINPLEENGQKRGEGRILVRDGERERRILELMEQSGFIRTEAGYFLEGEEAEYDFLYHAVPQLEKLAEVYATSAVKVRIHISHAPPKAIADVDERTDWLEFKFQMDGIHEADIRRLLQALAEKRRYYRLPNGALLPLESPDFQEIVRFLNEMGIGKADVMGSAIRLPAVRGLLLLHAEKQGNTVKLGKSLRRLLEDMRNPEQLDFPVPEHLAAVLRDYQKDGFQWMKMLAHYQFGGVLADDMGLGKTIQSISFIASVLPEIRARKEPAIIVSPSSLLYNWRNELQRFAPEIRTAIADGTKEERAKLLQDTSQMDAIITSYPLLRRDLDLYAGPSFHTLILDEAQAFKNYATQTALAVKAIQARHRFALTGTPVENRLEELWSIFDAVFPELFPGRRDFGELSRENVARRIRPFLLRRLKADVLQELPDKIESLHASELLPEQKKLYAAYLAELQQETLKHLSEDGLNKHRIRILAGLTRLRQLCCHPGLFVEGYTGSSAKFEQLLEMVEECRSAGKRVLVFSQFTEMLGLIGRELGYRGVPHFYLDGQTPASDRVELCNRFNEGERDLFLISLKAGGTGLNLAGADTVILYDLWWNPAVEDQAASRAHRIGQKNVVHVIRLVAQGTVEDKMYELQQSKKNLIEEVIRPGQEALSSLTEEEIKQILMI